MQLRYYIIKTLILVTIAIAITYGIFKFFLPYKFLYLYATLPVLFGIVNIFIYKALLKTINQPLIRFTNKYLLCTTLKLLGSIFFIICFLIFNKEHAIPFLSVFLILYLTFLAQEIVEILNFFKKKSKSETNQDKS